MRHGVKKVKLGSDRDHGRSMVRNISIDLIIHEKVKTIETRARAVMPLVEKLIGVAKRPNKTLAIKHISKALNHENASKKLIEVLAKKYEGKNSGYVRKTFLKYRKGDNAHLVLIELV
ncbi:MAG: 50S ribosomal protein L17 [Candidatus Gracilibacteria bacterium]